MEPTTIAIQIDFDENGKLRTVVNTTTDVPNLIKVLRMIIDSHSEGRYVRIDNRSEK